MEFAVTFLAIGTLISVAVLAQINIRQTDDLRRKGYRSALAGGRKAGPGAA
jgi:hypothetical protein